ncbi:MAG TPA: hypothetical protein VJA27_02660 [Patescibacteria group bacterium]|nr:hypothetical protein [Patescibacteria group bacterium]
MKGFLQRIAAFWVIAALIIAGSPLYTLAQSGEEGTSGGSSEQSSPAPSETTSDSSSGSSESSGSSGSTNEPSGTQTVTQPREESGTFSEPPTFQPAEQPGNFSPPSDRQDGGTFRGQGPSSEMNGDEMQKRQEERDSKMRERGAKQLKRGVEQFNKMLTRFEGKMKRLEGQGIPIPAECKEGVESAKAIVKSVLENNDPEFFESFDHSELQDASEVMQVCGPKLEQLSQLPRVLKQINNHIKQLERKYTSVQKKVARSKVDVGDALQAASQNISDIKAIMERVKKGEEEDAFGALDEMREKFESTQYQLHGVESILQFKKAVKSYDGQMKRYERQVVKLEKKGAGAEARSLFNDLKQSIAELQATTVTADNAEEVVELLQDAAGLRADLEDELGIGNGSPDFYEFKKQKAGQSEFEVQEFEKLILEHKVKQQFLARSHALQSVQESMVAGVKVEPR